jgi:hypothetical protein
MNKIEEFLKRVSNEAKETIAVDFDGVVHKYSKGISDGSIYDGPMEDVAQALKDLASKYKIVLFTCRANPDNPIRDGKTGKESILNWLKKWTLNDYISEITYIKPRAIFYIDDRGIKFDSWNQVINDIHEWEQTNKK